MAADLFLMSRTRPILRRLNFVLPTILEQRVIGINIFGRTFRSSYTYILNALLERNLQGDEMKNYVSIAEFKRKRLATTKPQGKSTDGCHDIKVVDS